MNTLTFKCYADTARKLKAEPAKNRRFNTKSEIIRTVVDLYLTDPIVKHAIHEGMKRKYGAVIDDGIL